VHGCGLSTRRALIERDDVDEPPGLEDKYGLESLGRHSGIYATWAESHDQSFIEADLTESLALAADTYVGMTSSDPTEPNDMTNIVVFLVR
jgi:hypothetical protein